MYASRSRCVTQWVLLFTVLCFIGLAAQNAPSFEELSQRANAAREANDVKTAIELYQQAVQVNPKWAEGWWYLGSLYYDSDQYASGADALARVVDLDPKAAPAWALLGLCEFETGQYGPSLQHIERALASGSVEPRMEGVLRYHEAQLLTRSGEFDRAITAYVWFARRGVQNAELISAIGLAALRSPRFPKDIQPKERDLYQAAGQAAYLSMSGQFANAQSALSDLVSRFPKAPYVHYLYGCFLMAVKPEVAMRELHRELEISPGSGAANTMIAMMMLQEDDARAALPYAEAAVKGSPDSVMARYVLGRCLIEGERVSEALEQLKLAEQRDPGNLDVHISLATAYSRAGRPKEAREERVRSLELWKEKDAVANP